MAQTSLLFLGLFRLVGLNTTRLINTDYSVRCPRLRWSCGLEVTTWRHKPQREGGGGEGREGGGHII